VIQRMGFGLEELRKYNPKIVLASISGQGDSGPRSGHVTYGSTLEANSGMSSLMSYEDGVPYTSGYNLNYPDQTVCLYGAAAIALVAQKAQRNNTAIHIDISQRDTAAFIMGPALELVASGLDDRPESIKAALSNSVFDGMVLSSDAEWIAVHVPDWQRLAKAGSELSVVSSTAELNAWAGGHTALEIESALSAVNCGAQRCLNGKAMFDAEIDKGSGIFARTSTNQLVKGFPFKFAQSEMTIHTESPTIGEHNTRFIA
ncbi:MAG: CoA transferase, partial [Halieaceae bacterium]